MVDTTPHEGQSPEIRKPLLELRAEVVRAMREKSEAEARRAARATRLTHRGGNEPARADLFSPAANAESDERGAAEAGDGAPRPRVPRGHEGTADWTELDFQRVNGGEERTANADGAADVPDDCDGENAVRELWFRLKEIQAVAECVTLVQEHIGSGTTRRDEQIFGLAGAIVGLTESALAMQRRIEAAGAAW